ncbi:Co2+/Mg2+ efflux protein ApaG [Acetobacter pasteurianus]|uniref:Co2+/Mg2+ efflux protein ApaG n=1 Tax=Acetobacter pasteurianus TaxID=438 RepID=UPI000F56C6E0|nr:Co2+/Mg2+ efflux protein ApaG [Acetobacter pasteurianus]GCD56398.1 magnesium transporter [Acetobacter pasteurianus NBRC 3222]
MPDWATSPLLQDPEEAMNELFSSLPVYEAVTENVRVQVQVFWLPDQSEPDEHSYCWAYRIRIGNDGPQPVQLLERTWHITDTAGHTEYVHGSGVVGELPVIQPGALYEYTSGASLATPGGFMSGHYLMQDKSSGRRFDASIPAFSLDSPFLLRQIH